MKKVLAIVFLLSFAAASRAGEEVNATRFDALARIAEKIFVGKIAASEVKDKAKILSVTVVEAWSGCQPAETVKLLVFDGMVHQGDPSNFPGVKDFLFYVRKAPNKDMFSPYGSGFYVPVAGDSSTIPLQGADGNEIKTVAHRYLDPSSVSMDEVRTELQSSSTRVRRNAIAFLNIQSVEQVRQETATVLTSLQNDTDAVVRLASLNTLSKGADPGSVSPLVDFALGSDWGAEMIPMLAHTLNRIDAAATVQAIQAKEIHETSSTQEIRAASLLSRLDAPEALAELLTRARNAVDRDAIVHTFASVQVGEGNSELQNLVLTGSLEEKKAASYTILRWGSPEDKAFLNEQSLHATDSKFKTFLKRLLKEPYLSFGELR